MTITEILDIILPYTKADERCGFKKNRKALQRVKLALKIEDLKIQGLTDEQIINDTGRTVGLLEKV